MNSQVTITPGPVDGGVGSQVMSASCSCCSDRCNAAASCGLQANMVPGMIGNEFPATPEAVAAMVAQAAAANAVAVTPSTPKPARRR